MKKLLKYLLELLIIIGKLVVFTVLFQILVSVLTTMSKAPIEWYNANVTLSSKAFIFYLGYVLITVVLFYLVGRYPLRFKATKLTNAIFVVIVFLLAIGEKNMFGKNDFYSIVSPYFSFHEWFNFDITISAFNISGVQNYMKVCDWLIISVSMYFGMSSEIFDEGRGLVKMKEADRKANSGEIELKKFTEEEKERIYANIRSVKGSK